MLVNHPVTELHNLVLGPQEGKVIPLLGNTVIIKLSGKDSNGQLTVIDYQLAVDGPCPPPHRHSYAEVFYVLEGCINFQIEGQMVPGPARTTVIVPAGVTHTYTNGSQEPARYLIACSPAGLDGYFEELGQFIAFEPVWPPKDMSYMVALNKKYDTEVVVPEH